jgi:tRNA(Ile)-lysidine synthase
MEKNFQKSFSKVVNKEDVLILAVSGGIDSMVLLDLVRKHHTKEKIIVAHFDHSLRGAESDGDRDFIAKFCEKNTITFEFEKLDI